MTDIVRSSSQDKEAYRQVRRRVAKRLRGIALRLAFNEMMPDYVGQEFSALDHHRALRVSRAALYDAALDIAVNKPLMAGNLKEEERR